MKKYKLLLDDTCLVEGETLYRIQSLKQFGNVNAGDLGGYVASEANLSQIGNCWVYDLSYVYGNARVYGDARVYDKSYVFGNAQVYENAQVYGNAWVYGNAGVSENAWVCENAQVSGNALVYGDARVYGNAQVVGTNWLHIYGDSKINFSINNNIGTTLNISSNEQAVEWKRLAELKDNHKELF